MRSIFIDTGFIIALESVTDQNHEKASQLWNELLKDLPVMVTTTYVIDEIVTFFNIRSRHAKAVEIGDRLMNSRSVQVIHIDKGLAVFPTAFQQDLFNDGLYFFNRNERAGERVGFVF